MMRADVTPPVTADDLQQALVTAVISTGVVVGLIAAIASIISGLISKRVRSRADIRDDKTQAVTFWQAQAEGALAAAASIREDAKLSVALVRESLADSVANVGRLQSIIETLNDTIKSLTTAATVNDGVVATLRGQVAELETERDRLTVRIGEQQLELDERAGRLEHPVADIEAQRAAHTGNGTTGPTPTV